MKALLSREPGGPSTLVLGDIPEPAVGPGQVRVAVRACGVNMTYGTSQHALKDRAADLGVAALCAEALGIMLALNQATLSYTKTRKQFGLPIGSFQALQHRMADMFIATEQTRSMVIIAALDANSNDAVERRRAVSGAKAYVGRASRFVGRQAVQLHGAMGDDSIHQPRN